MLWLLPFLCSGAICWLNRDRIAAVAAPRPVRAVVRPMFGAGPFATPYPLPRGASYGSLPYGTGLLLPPAPSVPNAPAASPFAYATPEPEAAPMPAPAPGSVYAGTLAGPMPVAAAESRAPIALLRCGPDGCMIRPEPRAWDDATLGRMPGAFTAPKDFPIYVLSYGPVGWANVLVNHPDEGAVEGWVETRSLTDASSTPGSMPASAAPTPGGASSSMTSMKSAVTGAAAAAKVNGRKDAMARHLQFMKQRQNSRSVSPPARRGR